MPTARIIFGTNQATPAEMVARRYHDGLAPFIILTGGVNRHTGVLEAIEHRRILLELGVPEAILRFEDSSTTTLGNVERALQFGAVRAGNRGGPAIPLGIDPSIPSTARVYDYMLGACTNYESDRHAAASMIDVLPETPMLARDNRLPAPGGPPPGRRRRHHLADDEDPSAATAIKDRLPCGGYLLSANFLAGDDPRAPQIERAFLECGLGTGGSVPGRSSCATSTA